MYAKRCCVRAVQTLREPVVSVDTACPALGRGLIAAGLHRGIHRAQFNRLTEAYRRANIQVKDRKQMLWKRELIFDT